MNMFKDSNLIQKIYFFLYDPLEKEEEYWANYDLSIILNQKRK